jgi:transcriptional regulator with XRE-family HTH domain
MYPSGYIVSIQLGTFFLEKPMSHWNGARLRELRVAAGLSQTELAERVGVQRGAVARWESDEREPNWSNVVALAKALGVDCRAFTEEPSTEATEPRKPGRPRKKGEKEEQE